MGPTFKKFWHSYRTASFLGRQGRNVAWDYVLERMNRDFKQFLGCYVTEARLESFAQMLNGLKHVKRMVSNTWGLDRFDAEYEYSHVLDSDVSNLVFEIKEALGRSAQEIEQRGVVGVGGGGEPDLNHNPFNTNRRATTMPWTKVEDDGLRDLEAFVRRHCTMLAR